MEILFKQNFQNEVITETERLSSETSKRTNSLNIHFSVRLGDLRTNESTFWHTIKKGGAMTPSSFPVPFPPPALRNDNYNREMEFLKPH